MNVKVDGMSFLSKLNVYTVHLFFQADIQASPNLTGRHIKRIFVTGCGNADQYENILPNNFGWKNQHDSLSDDLTICSTPEW